MALGGAVAAGLGAVATMQVLPHLPPEWRPAQPAVEATEQAAVIDEPALIAAAEAAGDAAGERAALRVLADQPAPEPLVAGAGATSETAQVLPEDLTALAERLDALETQLADLPASVPVADAAPDDLSAGDPVAEPAVEPAADLAPLLAALQARVDEQQAALDELAARPAFDADAAQALQQQIEDSAAEAEARLADARTEAEALQAAAAEGTRRAEAVAAIAALQSALDRGVTPDEARTALANAGLEAPEALAQPVPSLASLQAEFPEAARAALRAGLSDESASGQGNLVGNFLRAQTGARSVAPREGTDADAVLSRANAQVEAGDIRGALAELSALPQPAQAAPAMTDWLARAQAHANAKAALSDLSPDQN